jgi:predicted anti-sigma-YlaC factor YlaD
MPKYKTNECENVQTQLSAYFDNQIPTWKRHLIRWHLKRCSVCKTQAKTIEQTDKLLRFVEPVKASNTFLSDVMLQASAMKTSQKTHQSLFNRFGSFVESLQVWTRNNIRAYNPIYMFGLIFGVFMMIGVTLYSPRMEKLNPFPQFSSKSPEDQQERLISFEVILQQEPKRSLKIR